MTREMHITILDLHLLKAKGNKIYITFDYSNFSYKAPLIQDTGIQESILILLENKLICTLP